MSEDNVNPGAGAQPTAPSSPPAPNFNPGPAPSANPQISLSTPSGCRPSDVVKMAQQQLDAGLISLDEANKRLAFDSLPPLEAKPIQTPEEKAHAAMFPAAKAEEFTFPNIIPKNATEQEQHEALEGIKHAQGYLAAAEFPKAIGDFVASEIHSVNVQHEKMNENQKAIYRTDQENVLRKMWGPKFNERVGLARQLVQEIEAKQPGATRILEETGGGNSAFVIAKFADHADFLGLKYKGRKS